MIPGLALYELHPWHQYVLKTLQQIKERIRTEGVLPGGGAARPKKTN